MGPDAVSQVFAGLAEAMVPLVLGFAVLAVA